MKKVFVIVFALLSISSFAALSLVVKPLSGMECITALGNIGKITYSNDSIYVYDAYKEVIFSDLLQNVQHIRFSDVKPSVPTDVENLQGENMTQVLVYPNPTQNLLHVKNAQADFVRLYTAAGQLVQSAQMQDGEIMINLSSCPAGSYLLLCGNEAFQIIKK